MIDGVSLSILGAFISVVLAGIGTIIGTYFVASGGAGLVSQNPKAFGPVLLTSALPSSQGIYGFLAAVLILQQGGILGGGTAVSYQAGMSLLFASLPVGLLCLVSGIMQGKTLESGLRIISSNPAEGGKSVILGVLLESMAVFGLLLSILIISNIK